MQSLLIVNKLIHEMEQKLEVQKAIQQAQKIYYFKQNVTKFNFPEDLRDYFFKIKQKKSLAGFHRQRDIIDQYFQAWRPAQYRIFFWVTTLYSFLQSTNVKSFNKKQKQFIYELFSHKKSQFINYNLAGLTSKERTRRDDWTQEQQKILFSILKQSALQGKWTEISYRLFIESNQKSFKNPLKCRQKWFNYLHPEINRKKWTKEQDLKLIDLINDLGTKWAAISKIMPIRRTQHMIKNRYNSLIKKWQHSKKKISLTNIIENIHQKMNKKSLGCKKKFKNIKQLIEGQAKIIENEIDCYKIQEQKVQLTLDDYLILPKFIFEEKSTFNISEDKLYYQQSPFYSNLFAIEPNTDSIFEQLL